MFIVMYIFFCFQDPVRVQYSKNFKIHSGKYANSQYFHYMHSLSGFLCFTVTSDDSITE